MSSASSLSSGRSSHLKKRVGKYYLGRTIGEGTYAKVKYGQHADTGEAVAVKVLDKEHLIRTGMVEQIKREISILKQVHHPHVVDLKEVMSSKDKIYVVTELVSGGELFDKIVAEGPMKEPGARIVFSQLLDAVWYCHSQGVFHRDIKPENVLLSSGGEVKLSDFGLGTLRPAGGLLNTVCGTPNYVAPEVLAKGGYHGGPADVWSLGVVLYVMLAGCLPFDEDDLPTLFNKISAAEYEVPPWVSPAAKAMLRRMIDPDPHTRATADGLWSQGWMRGGLVRRSMVTPPTNQQLAKALQQDIFQETVEPEAIRRAYALQGSQGQLAANALSPGSQKRLNAFELIKSGLDISGMFEQREDVVTRHTRFTSLADLPLIVSSIESATVAVGGRVESRSADRLRLLIPQRRGGAIRVLVEVLEVLPGRRVVDLQKTSGSTIEFHAWYQDLTAAVSSIITKKSEKAAGGPGGGKGAGAGAGQQAGGVGGAAAAGGQQARRSKLNAFQLINSSFNLGALLETQAESEGAAPRCAQFSSRAAPADILAALEAAAKALGGSSGGSTAASGAADQVQLMVPGRGGRKVDLLASLIPVLPGVTVCRISMLSGSSLDFYKAYSLLAAGCSHVMMRRDAHPLASNVGSLLQRPSAAAGSGGGAAGTAGIAGAAGDSMLLLCQGSGETSVSLGARELHTDGSLAAELSAGLGIRATGNGLGPPSTNGSSYTLGSLREHTLSGSLGSLLDQAGQGGVGGGSPPAGSSPRPLPVLWEQTSGPSPAPSAEQLQR